MKAGYKAGVAGIGDVSTSIDQKSSEWLVIAIAALGILFLIYWFAKQEVYNAGKTIAGALPNPGDIAGGIGETAGNIAGGIGETAGNIAGGIGEAFAGVTGGIGEAADNITTGAALTWEGYMNTLGDVSEQAGRNLQEAAGRAPEAFSNYMQGISTILPPYSPAAYLADIAAGAPDAVADTLRSWGIWK